MTEPDHGHGSKTARTATLVGRESHREAFAAAYRTMLAGNPIMLLVKGRSGSGKSALVQSILEGLEERGEAVVLSGRCYERESVPYKALDSLIDDLARYLLSLPDDTVATLLPRDLQPLTRVFPVLLQVKEVAEAARASRALPPDRQELRRRAFAGLASYFAGSAIGARWFWPSMTFNGATSIAPRCWPRFCSPRRAGLAADWHLPSGRRADELIPARSALGRRATTDL